MPFPVQGPTIPLMRPHEPFEALREGGAVQPGRELPGAGGTQQPGAVQRAGEAPFAEVLEAAAAKANQQILDAQAAGEAFAAGQTDDIHGTMLALSKADIELRLMGNVKNKIVDAFYELWRMQA